MSIDIMIEMDIRYEGIEPNYKALCGDRTCWIAETVVRCKFGRWEGHATF